MPLPKAKVLQSTANAARNNDWKFAQTQAPKAGPGALTEELLARITPGSLPTTKPVIISGAVAGYSIEQTGRHKTFGEMTFTVMEATDGAGAVYFEKLKGLNNPRDSSGELTGIQILEDQKEGEYTLVQSGPDGKQFKKYVIKQSVIRDVHPNDVSKSEDAEFVEYTITMAYKDFAIFGPNNEVLS